MLRIKYFFFFGLVLFGIKTQGQSFKDLFISKEDKSIDISEFLNSTTGFLPVPVIITEPAVGFGGGMIVTYFHKDKTKKEKGLSPTMTFGGGAYTSNKTWMALLGHKGSYLDDQIRYLGILGLLSANMTYYGFDNTKGNLFNLQGFLTLQELLFKVNKETPLFLGFNYLYFNNTVSFETGIEIPELEVLQSNTNTAGLNAVIQYDTRNNSFTPTGGFMSVLEFGRYSKYLGGDTDYWNFSSKTFVYAPILKEILFSGYRLDLAAKSKEAPFYELPYINLRGIPMMRYQGQSVVTMETEWRWKFYKRWSLIGFVGAGSAQDNFGNLGKDLKVAGGAGFRYFLAKQYGLHAGIDVSRGPEIWAWNLTIGSNWLR